MTMPRIGLGIGLGILWGVVDVLLTVRGGHAHGTEMLMQAFTSRFALGFLGANVVLPMHPVAAGALVGLLVSLPDAFGLKAYGRILGTGLLFGALTGLAVKVWAR